MVHRYSLLHLVYVPAEYHLYLYAIPSQSGPVVVAYLFQSQPSFSQYVNVDFPIGVRKGSVFPLTLLQRLLTMLLNVLFHSEIVRVEITRKYNMGLTEFNVC